MNFHTVNVDIFASIHFREILGQSAISRQFEFVFLLSLTVCGIIKLNFALYIFSPIFQKRELCENIYSAKMIYFRTVYIFSHNLCLLYTHSTLTRSYRPSLWAVIKCTNQTYRLLI